MFNKRYINILFSGYKIKYYVVNIQLTRCLIKSIPLFFIFVDNKITI